MSLNGKKVLITGSARRIGRSLALAIARNGADVILHHGHSQHQAEETKSEIQDLGSEAHILQADLNDPKQTAELVERARSLGPLFALINNAAIFEPLNLSNTSLVAWNRHLRINLTAPFLLCQAFGATLGPKEHGRIVNILDWRALRPGKDHLPYTISKAGLVALTQSLAQAMAPNVTVNGLAFGAILPPSDGGETENMLANVPAGRWAEMNEVDSALLFLLTGPAYITGEIIHVDGGRHLV